jgi:hypothetical protein
MRARALGFAWAIAGAVVVVPATIHAAKPPGEKPQPPLRVDVETAEQLYAKLEYEKANEIAQKVIVIKGLTHDQMVRAYRVLAITYAVLEKEEDARDAFVLLLTYDPDYKLDPNLGPRVTTPFQEARGYWRAQPMKPGIEATVVVRVGEGGVIRVTTRDPTKVTRKVNVGYRWASAGDFTTQVVPVAEGVTVDVPAPPPDKTRLDYYVQAIDDRDCVAFEVGSPMAPKSAFADQKIITKPPPRGEEKGGSVFGSPVFWTVTTVVVAGAVVGGYFLFKPKDQEAPTSATLAPTLNCGFGAKCN